MIDRILFQQGNPFSVTRLVSIEALNINRGLESMEALNQ
jgi:hypothetical protein